MYEKQEQPLRELARSEPLQKRVRLMTESVTATSPNGVKLVRVVIETDPITNKPKDEARLDVHFYNPNYLTGTGSIALAARPKEIFPISGGARVRGGDASGQIQVNSITPSATDPNVLILVVKPVGDYSTYLLTLITPAAKNWKFDPLFAEIQFKFRPGCFNNNCAPEWEAALPPFEEPVIDYLAKDYGSFRRTMIDAMASRVPGWQMTSEADLDTVLAEMFAVAADELSDYQDRVMNEAYLSSSRKRVSLARHSRLMDYHIHQGSQASTWVALEIKHDTGQKSFELADHLHVWAGEQNASGDETGNTVDFLSKYDGTQNVHQYLNSIGLYTWSDTITSLKAGTTRADLKLYKDLYLNGNAAPTAVATKAAAEEIRDLIKNGKIKYLVIQEHLNPQTGLRPGRDPAKRQILTLLPDRVEAMEDLITSKWFVRVRWDKKDALKHDYCFTVDCPTSGSGTAVGKVENVSLFHGNLVTVCHGREQSNIYIPAEAEIDFSDPDKPLQFHYERTQWGAICRMPEAPLAYRQTMPGGDYPPFSTLEVTVKTPGGNADPWDERPNLIHSDDGSETGDHFVVETDEDRRSLLRFGNGINGRALPDKAVVTCTYQYGMPLDGNVGADRIINFEKASVSEPLLVINQCWNPFDVTNGIDREPVHEIVRRVPEAYRYRQLRAITLADYVDRAEQVPGVSRAAASYAWTGSWRTVRITIDPEGTNELSYSLRNSVADSLNAVRLIGEDLEIRPPHFVPLDINVIVCAAPDFWIEDVSTELEQEFSAGWTHDGRHGFFHPDEWTFGQPLYSSQIVGRILQVRGIEHAVEQKSDPASQKTISVSIKRWNSPHRATESLTDIAPNEIIQVMNDPDHMELGSVRFVVKGGRQ
jgi:hypothetical protein